VASSLIGAAVWAIIALALDAARHRRGAIAGHWYQVTFDPDDTTKVWSIELVVVKHYRESISGTMWRIYPAHFDRRWTFDGRCRDYFVRAQYWADRGDGGEGTLKLFRYRRSNCAGRFEEEQPRSVGFGASFIEFAAPMEWIRVDGDQEPAVLDKIATMPESRLSQNLPKRISRGLQRRLAKHSGRDGARPPLTYRGAMYDPTGPAVEAERLREQHHERWAATKREREGRSQGAGPEAES
jgi:hypothetical protein